MNLRDYMFPATRRNTRRTREECLQESFKHAARARLALARGYTDAAQAASRLAERWAQLAESR